MSICDKVHCQSVDIKLVPPRDAHQNLQCLVLVTEVCQPSDTSSVPTVFLNIFQFKQGARPQETVVKWPQLLLGCQEGGTAGHLPLLSCSTSAHLTCSTISSAVLLQW